MHSDAEAAGRWRLRRRLGRLFLGVLVVFLGLTAVVAVASVRFVNIGNDVVYRYLPAASASQRMLSDLLNQETSVRGYVLSGHQASLEPYNEYVLAQKRDTRTVDRLVANDDDRFATLVQRFNAAATAWQRQIADPLLAQVRSGAHPGVSEVDAGQAQFNRIRVRGSDLTAQLQDKAASARSARARDGVFAAVALGLVLLLFAGLGGVLWRGLHGWVLGPIDRLGEQTRRVASGDLTSRIRPDGPGELLDLGADVEGMRAQIVAELARAEEIGEDLRLQGEELARSNADLQQFAYVASHDLSEPLRKVANFCQLLERQYADQLDDRARQYIDFAVDGAKRMQTLITDLLALSRVGRTTEGFVPVDIGAALDQAVATLGERMRATGARVERTSPLPTVRGDHALLVSLLENLVGNAVKYSRADVAPLVRVGAEHDGAIWTLRVSDNGIGIDEQYAERIFAVFQRLHLRDQYGGTGIGLALCRRIVEYHGGHIWLDTVRSAPGATFTFTLPEGGPRAEQDV